MTVKQRYLERFREEFDMGSNGEIIASTTYDDGETEYDSVIHLLSEALEAQREEDIKEFEKIIGEMEDSNVDLIPGVGGFDIEKETRNELKVSQHQALAQLKGKAQG